MHLNVMVPLVRIVGLRQVFAEPVRKPAYPLVMFRGTQLAAPSGLDAEGILSVMRKLKGALK